MENIQLTFKIVSKEQLEEAEINFGGAKNRPLLETTASLANVLLRPSAVRSEGEDLLYKANIKSFKNTLLWVMYHHTGTINRANFLATFPFVEKEEVRGLFALSIFNLAHQTIDFAYVSNAEIPPYRSGLEWWRLCMIELLMLYFESSERVSSSTLKKEMKTDLAALEAYQNPASPTDAQKYPHLNRLLDTAMSMAKHQPKESNQLRRGRKDFRNFYWKKFLSAYEDFLKHQTQPNITYLYLNGDSLNLRPAQKKKNVPTEIRISSKSGGFKSGRGKKPESK